MPDTMDEVLEILSDTDPEYGDNALANHGPMAAEALVVMGRSDVVMPWAEAYKSRLQEPPQARDAISRDDWRESLGDTSRIADWIVFFDRELAEAPWAEVLGRWVPRLAPAVVAAGTHGLIRTAHAVRSLADSETPQRVHELAEGLGFWAARYKLLPGTPSGGNAGHTPGEALAHVQRINGPDVELRGGGVAHQLSGLDHEPSFTGAIDLADTSGDLSRLISDLTETFAGLYLTNDRGLVAFVHGVTAPSALRHLVPYISETEARVAARYAWQACAAIYAWYATGAPPSTSDYTAPTESHEELIDRAVAANGPHSIKFTEACLREYALNPKPVYLAAAYDAAERVGAS